MIAINGTECYCDKEIRAAMRAAKLAEKKLAADREIARLDAADNLRLIVQAIGRGSGGGLSVKATEAMQIDCSDYGSYAFLAVAVAATAIVKTYDRPTKVIEHSCGSVLGVCVGDNDWYAIGYHPTEKTVHSLEEIPAFVSERFPKMEG
jgi:hypothetical protein